MSLLHHVQEDILERLGRVGITARQAVESILSGQHRGMRRGLSVEFAGHRPYQLGDDIRHLDWTVFARTDRLDVRLFDEETRLRATLIVDCSGSMDYTSHSITKLDFARNLAAALGLLMVGQGDSVGLVTCDDKIREHIPPLSSMSHLLNMLSILESNRAGGDTALGPLLEDLAERLHRRGLVILLSDCIDNTEHITKALHHMRYRKQDVRLIHICDPQESQFTFSGAHCFSGFENEPDIIADADRIRHHYQQQFLEHQQELARLCHQSGIVYHSCLTDQDIVHTLIELLNALSRGRR